MTVAFDEDIILAKAATVRRCVGVIRKLWLEDEPDVPEWVRLDVTVLNLQRAVEACLDIGNHLIAVNSWGLPGAAVEAFERLVDHGVLPASELKAHRGMVGFRNIAVHNYRTIDNEIVEAIVHKNLGDLERLVDRVVEATIGNGETGT